MIRALALGALLAGCPSESDDTGETGPPPCGDGICVAGDDESVETCPYDCGFPWLVLVDLGGDNGGATPGVDLDAVKLFRDGEDHWAESVGGSAIGGSNNQWTDPALSLGPSDSECRAQNFVSLGGRGSWIAVSFGEDWPIRSGDVLTVYELSADMCNNGSINDVWEALLAPGPSPDDGEYLVTGAGLGEFEVGRF